MVNDEYYLWGAGKFGARVIEFLKKDIAFKAVIDNDPKKQGTLFRGLPVISFDEASSKLPETKIIIAMNRIAEIKAFLQRKRFIENQDYYSLIGFIPRYYWAKNKSLVFRTVSIGVTTKCTMKCKGCNTLIPYVVNSKNIDTENILNDIDLLFSYVDSVITLNITVGESLINQELPDICFRIFEKFSGRYAEMIIQTNATVLPDDDAMRSFSKSKVFFVPSNYPENKTKTEVLINKCNEFGVGWYYNEAGGNRENWFDPGNPNCINETSPVKLQQRYKECRKPGMGLYNGWLYICAQQTWSHVVAEAGIVESGDAFDLRQPVSETSREELYRIITQQPTETGYLSQCMRCYGTNTLLRSK